jgi:SAM-dependent methyltransferase
MAEQAIALSDPAHRTSCEIQARLEEYAPNYTRWIVGTARRHVGRRLVDVGCSIGNITRHFVDRELLVGVDPNPYAIERARQEWADRPNVQLHQLALPHDAFAELAELRLDSAMCINVLEHVHDDAGMLGQIAAALQPGGRLFLLVPAHPWLYGTMDAADLHYRRYTRQDLADKVKRAGMQVLSMWSMNAPGVLGWFVNGRILRRPLIPSVQAGLYDRVVPLVGRLEQLVHPPVGQSLVLVAQR